MSEIIRKEEYLIKPFKEILVTDPWYLEQEKFKNRNDLIFNEKPRCCNIGAVIISEVHDRDEEYDFDFNTIYFSIILAKDEKQLDLYRTDRHYKNTIKKQEMLGCDTARFEINVIDKKNDYRSLEFQTGADGFYGQAIKYKEYYGMRIDLEIDSDMISFDEVIDNLSYLFKFDKEKDKIETIIDYEQEDREV